MKTQDVVNLKMVSLMLAVFLPSVMTRAATVIHVRHEAHVVKPNVELGDIAEITGADEGATEILSQLIIGASPKPGTEAVWTAEDLSQRLRPYDRLIKSAQVTFPERLIVYRVSREKAFIESVTAQITGALKATKPDSSWEIQVLNVHLPADVDLPKGGSVQVIPPLTRPRGATNIEVVIFSADGQITKRIWVPVKLKYFASVATTTRTLDAYTKISPSDVHWAKQDVTFAANVPATAGDLESAVARTTIPAGTAINKDSLERDMALHFGQEVELAAGDDSFVITTKGIAQQNGFVGDVVRVKNVANNKIISGIVTAKGVVHVAF